MARLTEVNANQQPARVAPRPVVARRVPALVDRVARYFREVLAELRRVDWPSRPELVASTIVVVAVLVVLSVYLGLWDFLFSWLFTQIRAR
jgi:preprotein translocase subunit SecE